MSTDRETTRVVRSWLEEGVTALPDRVLDAVLDQVPATPQRRSWWPAWRSNSMSTYAKLIGAAAAVLLVAVVGYQFLPRNGGIGGQPTIAPSPSPTTLNVTGSFISHGAQIELNASGQRSTTGSALLVWSNVTGSMTATDVGGDTIGHFAVDLACARTSGSGLIMLGGLVTDSQNYDDWAPVGSRVAIVLQPGSPARAFLDATAVLGCAPFLASIGDIGDAAFDSSALEPIDGTIDIKP